MPGTFCYGPAPRSRVLGSSSGVLHVDRDELERLLLGEHAQAERARGPSGGYRTQLGAHGGGGGARRGMRMQLLRGACARRLALDLCPRAAAVRLKVADAHMLHARLARVDAQLRALVRRDVARLSLPLATRSPHPLHLGPARRANKTTAPFAVRGIPTATASAPPAARSAAGLPRPRPVANGRGAPPPCGHLVRVRVRVKGEGEGVKRPPCGHRAAGRSASRGPRSTSRSGRGCAPAPRARGALGATPGLG
eukprot:scaffold49882_cov69-Phaeocystis_antarctica.AAC.1